SSRGLAFGFALGASCLLLLCFAVVLVIFLLILLAIAALLLLVVLVLLVSRRRSRPFGPLELLFPLLLHGQVAQCPRDAAVDVGLPGRLGALHFDRNARLLRFASRGRACARPG